MRVDLKEKVEFAKMSAAPSPKILGMTVQKNGCLTGFGAVRWL